MVTTKELKPRDFWVHLNEEGLLDEKKAEMLLPEVTNILGQKGVILTIDLDGIIGINSKGFVILFNILKNAGQKNIPVYFSNVHPDIDELITTLTLTSDG